MRTTLSLLAAVLLLLPAGLRAEETQPLLREITILSQRIPLTPIPEPLTPNITVISRQQLNNDGYSAPQNILKNVPGAVFQDAVGNGYNGSVGFRSFVPGQDNVSREVYLLDGIRILGLDRAVAGDEMGLFDPFSLERVEVARGGSESIYGLNGGAGVVSVITRDPDPDKQIVEFESSGGENSTQSHSYFFSTPLENYSVSTSGRYLQTDGFRVNTLSNTKGTRSLATHTKFVRRWDEYDQELQLSFHSLDAWYHQPGNLSDTEFRTDRLQVSSRDEDDQSKKDIRILGLHYSRVLDTRSIFSFQANYNITRSEFISESGGGNVATTLFNDHQWGAVAEVSHNPDWNYGVHSLLIGGEYIADDEDNTLSNSNPGTLDNTRTIDAKVYSAYLQDRIELPDYSSTLTLAYRYDKSDIDITRVQGNNVAAIDPKRSASNFKAVWDYRVSPDLTLSLGASRSFNLPKSNSYLPSIFSVFFTTLPNPDLGAERNDELNAGLTWTGPFAGGTLQFSGVGFVVSQKDPIVFQSTGFATGINVNAGRIKREGFELQASYSTDRYTLDASYSDYRAIFTEIRGFAGARVGADIPNVPDNVFTLGVRGNLSDRLSGSIRAFHTGERVPDFDFDNSEPRTPSYTVYSGRLGYDYSENIEIFVEGDNLFDENYETYNLDSFLPVAPFSQTVYHVAGKPREIRAGARVQF